MTPPRSTRVVLDGGSRADAELLARAQWDQGASTGRAFGDLSTGLRQSMIEEAQRLLLTMAGMPGVTTLPNEERMAS